jgi:hypothetical protein
MLDPAMHAARRRTLGDDLEDGEGPVCTAARSSFRLGWDASLEEQRRRANPLPRQASRRGPILCHYRTEEQKPGIKVNADEYVWLLSGGWKGHGFAIGWTWKEVGWKEVGRPTRPSPVPDADAFARHRAFREQQLALARRPPPPWIRRPHPGQEEPDHPVRAPLPPDPA